MRGRDSQNGRAFTYLVISLVLLLGATAFFFHIRKENTNESPVKNATTVKKEEPKPNNTVKNETELKIEIPKEKDPLEVYKKLLSECDIKASKEELNRLYFDKSTKDELRNKIEDEMMTLAHSIMCENEYPDEFDSYTVSEGDNLVDIARRVSKDKQIKVEYGIIKLLNGIKSNVIKPGQKLRIPKSDMLFVVRKSKFKLFLFYDGIAIKSYKIGIGKEKKTPSGTFTTGQKTAAPVWYPPDSHEIKGPVNYGDPKNPLGTHWIGLAHPVHQGFGIHGTWEDDTIEKESSLGCIRLNNKEIQELFEISSPGMTVIIMD